MNKTTHLTTEPLFRVVEIFDSLEGEGKRAGATATFIRMAGCNMRCVYCDTAQALEFSAGVEMTLGEILAQVHPLYKRVTLTGGEPLLAQGVDELVQQLLARGVEVNIETNGSIDVAFFRARVMESVVSGGRLFFTIDYKLPSSGENEQMLDENYFALYGDDVLKFVVGSADDVPAMVRLVAQMQNSGCVMPQIYIGAVATVGGATARGLHAGFSLDALAAVILREPTLRDARMQLQFHKIIWGADATGV
ncbi:MAG: radical SAM protein [Defluviitaleaceae bacterium]|nr:radical SAM protein [Defluviitaleaceae bacterium]